MAKVKLQDIVAVSGQSGLHKILGRSRTGIIVEALDSTKKRMAVSLTTKVSVLNEISMYSKHDDINLSIILLNLKNSEVSNPGKNAQPDELKKFMLVALPDYDQERVYLSHIQKLANWFTIIKDILDYEDLENVINPKNTEEETKTETTTVEEVKEKKPKKTTKKASEKPTEE